jgi:hypothetical protein
MEINIMKFVDKDYIPLYLQMDEMTLCYIINNEVIGCTSGGMREHYPYNPYYILHKLFDSQITRKAIPERFHQFFTKLSYLPEDFKKYQIIGSTSDVHHYTIILDLKTSKSSSTPVEIFDIQFHWHSIKTTPRDSIYLTAQEAFLLFSNILANDQCMNYISAIDSNKLSNFEELDVKKHLDLYQSYPLKKYGKAFTNLRYFALDYMHYLKEMLLEEKITPYEISFYSGTKALAFFAHLDPVKEYVQHVLDNIEDPSNLSRNQKILYYCFINSLPYYSNQFVEIYNKQSYKKLYNLVFKDFSID